MLWATGIVKLIKLVMSLAISVAFAISKLEYKMNEYKVLHSPMGLCIRHTESRDIYTEPGGGAWQIINPGLKEEIGMSAYAVVEDMSSTEQDDYAYKAWELGEKYYGRGNGWEWWSSRGYCENQLAEG